MTEAEQTNRVCVVTGGSAGIGLAAALRFASLGYCIMICGRDSTRLRAARDQIAAIAPTFEAMELDLSKSSAASTLIEAARREFGRIDVLINNAGQAPLSAVDKLSKDGFVNTLAVNVEAVFDATQSVWPVMQQQQSGVIINISSLASVDPFTGFSVYGACKAWVNLFTKAVAEEGRPFGIRVYSVALGAVETQMLRGLFPDFPKEQTLRPEEVAEFLSHLCEEPMQYATGQTLFLRK